MPQSMLNFWTGYAKLTADTLTQRYVNRNIPADHQVFKGDGQYLKGKTAIVTGANTGLGLETVRMLAAAGATVIMGCRNVTKAEEAAEDVRASVPGANLEILQIDLSSTNSVREFARTYNCMETPRPLHILILNGGVMGVDRSEPETHLMVNHIGHALLSICLLPNLAAAGSCGSRIVFISSLTYLISDLRLDDLAFQKRKYHWMTAYANSKLCMILFMKALEKLLKDSAICVNAVHPGEATSDVARNLGQIWMTLHKRVGSLFLLSAAESARTSVYVAGAKEVGTESGKVFHRVNETLTVPEWLVGDDDVELLWNLTLKLSELTDEEVKMYIELAREAHCTM